MLGAPLLLEPLEDAVAKIKAALAARRNPNVTIIARTDALELGEVIHRAKAYVEAGAQLIMPVGRALKGIDDLRALRSECRVPLCVPCNAGGPYDLSQTELESVAGIVMFPLAALMTAAQTVKDNMAALCRTKSFAAMPHPTMKVPSFQDFIGYPEIEAERARFESRDSRR